jgi:RNA polymerase sigma factor (sigma-70 family)
VSLLRGDPALLRDFRRGDRAALERVYWAYVDGVERLVRLGCYIGAASSCVPGAPLADVPDLVQEVFARAFAERNRLGYDGLRDYRPYLHTIARNLLIDWGKRRGRPVDLATLADLPADVDDDWADAGVREAVARYLAGLPPELQALYQKRYVEDMPQRQAAGALGISRQNLRTLEDKLRKGLAQALESCGLSDALQKA